MMGEYFCIPYSVEHKTEWDQFVMSGSINGTFLHTRVFLEYHPPEKFKDSSLMIMNGESIVAVVPANIRVDNKNKYFISHEGSTFGGVIIGKKCLKIDVLDNIFDILEAYFLEHSICKVIIKMPGRIYTAQDTELLDYYFYNHGYNESCEVGYYVDFNNYNIDIVSNFSPRRRRGYKSGLKNEFLFHELETDCEIGRFYNVLCDNYKKFGNIPVHKIEELLELKNERLRNIVRFFGVILKDEMVGGSMVFCFEKRVFHTQYLATLQKKVDLHVSEYMYGKLIEIALKQKYEYLSFGTVTLDHGRMLNANLAKFKEGFGTRQYLNRTYTKMI